MFGPFRLSYTTHQNADGAVYTSLNPRLLDEDRPVAVLGQDRIGLFPRGRDEVGEDGVCLLR